MKQLSLDLFKSLHLATSVNPVFTGSPGMAFKLNESAISQGIEQVCAGWDAIRISDTAGLIQLSYTQDPAALAEAILDRYYKDRRRATQSDEKAIV